MALKDKVLLVTGGTSGIGEGCARHFASLGARVVMALNQPERGAALETELRAAGHEVRFIFTDVSREESVKAMTASAVQHYGRIDGVHCNAGVWAKGKATDFDEAAWEKVMGVNVKSVFWTAKHVVPVMEAQGQGVILEGRTRSDDPLPRRGPRGKGARRRHQPRHHRHSDARRDV
jgi:NAD(P)-dependent dehydrogenase (short-subunit alcohol dehydrogenase family)